MKQVLLDAVKAHRDAIETAMLNTTVSGFQASGMDTSLHLAPTSPTWRLGEFSGLVNDILQYRLGEGTRPSIRALAQWVLCIPASAWMTVDPEALPDIVVASREAHTPSSSPWKRFGE